MMVMMLAYGRKHEYLNFLTDVLICLSLSLPNIYIRVEYVKN